MKQYIHLEVGLHPDDLNAAATKLTLMAEGLAGPMLPGITEGIQVGVPEPKPEVETKEDTYDEPVEVETVAKHLADQSHQFTQYSGVRPFGVALIIAGVDRKGSTIYVTDPSGTYVSYSAMAIGSGSDEVNDFLEKNYNPEMSVDDCAALAIAAINLKSEEKAGVKHIKMAKVSDEDKLLEMISNSDLEKFDQAAKGKFVK